MAKAEKRKILFVMNPVSGDESKENVMQKVENFCKKHSFIHQIFETKGEGDLSLLQTELDNFEPDTAVAIGGDGTINLVAGAIAGTVIGLGIIPMGSANGLATELLIPENAEQGLELLAKNHTRSMDLLYVDDIPAAHLCDIGFNARLVKAFSREKVRGFRSYAKHFFEVLRTHKPNRFSLKFKDGSEESFKAHMVIVTNNQKYGTGAVINPQGNSSDGKFEVVVIRYYSPLHILQIFFALFLRNIDKMHYVFTYSADEVELINHKKESVNVDGEIIGDPVNIYFKNQKKAIKVIVPE